MKMHANVPICLHASCMHCMHVACMPACMIHACSAGMHSLEGNSHEWSSEKLATDILDS